MPINMGVLVLTGLLEVLIEFHGNYTMDQFLLDSRFATSATTLGVFVLTIYSLERTLTTLETLAIRVK